MTGEIKSEQFISVFDSLKWPLKKLSKCPEIIYTYHALTRMIIIFCAGNLLQATQNNK